MKLYLAILFFLISGVAQADSLAVTALFEDPVKILLSLFEGAVALTAFSGIAVVIGRRVVASGLKLMRQGLEGW